MEQSGTPAKVASNDGLGRIDWRGHGMDWALVDACDPAAREMGWCTGDIARAFAAGANAGLDVAAAKCREMAERMERSAQICKDNGEVDEVSPLRATAWQLTVVSELIRKAKNEA